MRPEKEKAGLLPPRPAEDGVVGGGSAGEVASRRRPADIFFQRSLDDGPVALDFACTSGLRSDTLRAAAVAPESVIGEYETFKRQYIGTGDLEPTETLCLRRGFAFVPMVIEAHSGGWSKKARQVLDTIARHAASAQRRSHDEVSLDIAQRLSCSLHRETARAVLRRLAARDDQPEASAWDPGCFDDFGDHGEAGEGGGLHA